jgi:hypothetical protein
VTLGPAALSVLEDATPAFVVLVASPILGWTSVLYCVVRGETDRPGPRT